MLLRRLTAEAGTAPRPRPLRADARPGPVGWTGLVALAIAAVLGDQLTKAAVIDRLAVNESRPVIWSLEFWHSRNTGIAFGLYTNKLVVVVVLTMIAVIWMLSFFARSGARHPLIPVAIGLLLGGTLSNLYDRAANGFVTDFIYLGYGPNFNLADTFIVTGVGVMIGALALGERER